MGEFNSGFNPAPNDDPEDFTTDNLPEVKTGNEEEDELGRVVETGPINRKPWNIVSETFLPFESPTGHGLSLVAVCSDGDNTTEHSISFVAGRDNDEQMVTPDGTESDEALRGRLRRSLLEDMNRPNTARLIDHRF